MAYKKYPVSAVKPYDTSEFYYNTYNIQNMLIVQHDFPTHVYKDENNKGDFLCTTYSDRVPSEDWEKALKHIHPSRSCDMWHLVPKEQLLKFASELFKQEMTGIRVIRDTHSLTGYPIWRIEGFTKGEGTPVKRIYETVCDIVEVVHCQPDRF